MNDRELLELAAKAAGYDYAKYGGYIVVDGIPGNWNPLTDDGDALRLAVKLGLEIWPHIGEKCVRVDWSHGRKLLNFAGDPYAATRRAIVCAAAEIGKAMP